MHAACAKVRALGILSGNSRDALNLGRRYEEEEFVVQQTMILDADPKEHPRPGQERLSQDTDMHFEVIEMD